MDRFYDGLESSLLAFGFLLSLAAFALLASPPAAPFSMTLPMLTVDVPHGSR